MACLLAQATGLDKKLDNATAMATVFVPINAAFDALAQQLNASLPALLAQTDMLTQVSNPPGLPLKYFTSVCMRTISVQSAVCCSVCALAKSRAAALSKHNLQAELSLAILQLQILEYHVVPGMTLASANLTDGLMLQTTLPGQSIKVGCCSCQHSRSPDHNGILSVCQTADEQYRYCFPGG